MILRKDCDVTIVVPENATEREFFAANELKKYLGMIFGSKVTVKETVESIEREKIIIGGPERNSLSEKYISKEEFDSVTPGPEGIFIKAYDDALILAGSSKNVNECERGTIYAVYEFLERFLDCSLSAYIKEGVKGGEFISRKESFDLENVFYAKAKSDIPYRCAVAQYSHGEVDSYALDFKFLDWLSKNRYNYIYTWSGVYENMKKNGMLEEAIKRGILFKVGHHDAIDTLLPQRGNKYFSEHYYETHPEFYKLTEDGKRFEMVDHWGQMVLCSRNEEMIETISKNLISWFTQNPQVKIFALLNKDGTAPQCCCEKCKGFSKVENYVYMINEVAKRLKKAHPDAILNMLAYTDLCEAPEGITLEYNVSVTEATWHITGLRTIGKPDGSCLSGTFFEDILLSWKKIGANVSYYDYFMGVYPGRQRYVPMADEMQAMCKRFIEKGIDGTETQLEVYNLWNNVFNFYTYGRTAYDTEKSLDDNLALFCRIFGEGAEDIKENIRYAESVLDGQSEIMRAGIYLMNNIDKEKMYDGFERALGKAETESARNNIRLMRMAFRYSDLETREKYEDDETDYKNLKHYDIPERGELLYMQKHFDTYVSRDGFGIMIPVEGEDNGFIPDKWYMFE